MSASPPERLGGVLGCLTLVLVALSLLVAGAYVQAHNTLFNNGRWTSTKTELAGGIIGAQSFFFDQQALARQRLNPSAWFGHQEVVSKSTFEPASIEFDFFLVRDAHLTFQFQRDERGYTGVRLSAAERFPPAVIQASTEGEFLRRRTVRQLRRARPARVHHFRVDFDLERPRTYTLSLNGKKLKTLRGRPHRPMHVGFRGSSRQVFVDNLRIVELDGRVFEDGFDRPPDWLRIHLTVLSAVLLGTALLYALLRRALSARPRLLLFYFLMFGGVLLAATGLYWALVWRGSEFYPDRNEQLLRRQEAYADAGTERMIARIEAAYAREPAPGVERILLLGSSQARGSGAAEAGDTLARQTERLLNEGEDPPRFECLNVAVRAYDLARMRADFDERWSRWGARLAVLNAGYNDRKTRTEPWASELRALIASAEAAGVQLVIVPEASAPEVPAPNLQRIHAATRRIARQQGVPVIEMHDHLVERADDGFLWWDWVHLTSYGQRLYAGHLVRELRRLDLLSDRTSSSEPAG